MTQEMQELIGTSQIVKPRAVVFVANNRDYDGIIDVVKAQFPAVKIIYTTTGPSRATLRVVKSIPLEMQRCAAQPLYTVE